MISIIIPTLNEEKVIEKTISQLRKIRRMDYEIIVSDGKSTDKTVEIAKGLADKVVEYKGEKRQTIAAGRNAGAAVAKGDYLVFIDADVQIPDPDSFFAEALHYFSIHQKTVGLTVFLKVLPEHSSLSDRLFFDVMNIYLFILNNYLHLAGAGGEFQMIKAESFKTVGGYNEKIAASEDYELFVRLSKIGETRVEAGLHVFHTARRSQQIGWPKLLFLWNMNFIWVRLFGHSYSREWEVIR